MVNIVIEVSKYLLILLIRALRKYLRGGEARREKAETCRTLGEILKAHRMRCQMTQEFVAEALGVSRQAVSKWETGTADPSTSNPGEALRCASGGAAAPGDRRGSMKQSESRGSDISQGAKSLPCEV